MSRTYRKPFLPDHGEDRMNQIERFLLVLRTHQKHKEHILDPIFYEYVQMFAESIENLPDIAKEAGDLILQTRPTHPILYIQFFESIVKIFPTEAKICRDCKLKFHPIENAETRNYCRDCM
jgi:hypothetical protein